MYVQYSTRAVLAEGFEPYHQQLVSMQHLSHGFFEYPDLTGSGKTDRYE
jgi:hypothetical protein